MSSAISPLHSYHKNSSLTDRIYPVGSVYISVVSTSPATLFGGTWVRIAKGRTLVGLDENDADFDGAEETGGSKTVTLVEGNLPSHTHGLNNHAHTVSKQTITTPTGGKSSVASGTWDGAHAGYLTIDSAHTFYESYNGTVKNIDSGHTHTFDVPQHTTLGNSGNTTATGSGTAHNNVQPYFTVYMWKRTA